LRFTLRQLAYFVAAGETGSITQASGRVNISQPSISTAIAQLEAEFGVQLFVRHHAQGLSLTKAGERMLQAAKALLEQAEGLEGIADAIATQLTGPLHIGAFETIAPLFLPQLCQAFLAQYSRVKIAAVTGDQVFLLNGVKRAQIHLALTYNLGIVDDIAFVPLVDLPPYALVSAEHPLAGRQALRLEELAGDPYIELDMPLSRDYFQQILMHENLQPRLAMRSHSLELVRGYVACGLGFSLVSSRPRNRAALNARPLAYVPLAGDYRPLVFGIASLRDLRKTPVVEAFEAYCRAMIGGDLLGVAP
jgi:DNA-binding transcriptional LysR family regulator